MPAFNYEVERILSVFLYKLFGVAHCVAYATLRLEAGQLSLEYVAWIRFCKFWLVILFKANHSPFIEALLRMHNLDEDVIFHAMGLSRLALLSAGWIGIQRCTPPIPTTNDCL